MPIPVGQALQELCITLTVTPQSKCITFPGGAEICVQFPGIPRDNGDLVRQLLAQANAALAPLQPIFNIIDAVVAIFNCVKAIPNAITRLKVDELVECLPDMVEKIQALLAIIPQLSLPLMLVALIDCLIAMLDAIKLDMLAIAREREAILAAGLRAQEPGNVALRTIVDCATLDLNVFLENLNEGVAPLNRLIGVINLFLDLIGLDGLPNVADLASKPSEEAIEDLCDLINILRAVRDAIPLP